MIINYLKSIGYTLGIILIGTIVITLFNYFGILNGNLFEIIKLLLPILAILLGGYVLGKVSNKKGYLEGLKFSLIFIFLIALFSLISKDLNWYNLIYYFLLIVFSILGSMIGINQKKEK